MWLWPGLESLTHQTQNSGVGGGGRQSSYIFLLIKITEQQMCLFGNTTIPLAAAWEENHVSRIKRMKSLSPLFLGGVQPLQEILCFHDVTTGEKKNI